MSVGPEDTAEDTTQDTFADLVVDLAPAMVIVTTAAGDQRAGCLVGFHSQCGIDPPRYVVWLSVLNHTYDVALHARTFAVHLLSTGDRHLAELFGARTDDEAGPGASGATASPDAPNPSHRDHTAKFDACRWTPGPDGVPLLDDCPNRFVGRRQALLDVGADHVAVVLAPVEAQRGRFPGPLVLPRVLDLPPGHPAS